MTPVRAFLWALFLVCFACGAGYSDGKRSGVITKFSRKGLIWKSWEGEMIQGGLRVVATKDGDQAQANVWAFHVPEGPFVDRISRAMDAGRPITIHYREWAVSPCSQNSDYDVVAIEDAKP